MNTILITCSKDKAVVQDDNGRFTNRVSNGVLVEVGDTLSVEQIAINSVGVGSDIVEIPRELGDYDYYTNETKLKASFYIHHNFEFTLQQPIVQGTLVAPVYWNNIRPWASSGLPGGIVQPNYGYLTGSGPATGDAPTADFQTLHTTCLKRYTDVVAGKRFHFITPTANQYDQKNLPDDDPSIQGVTTSRPTLSLYNFIDTTINLSVDVGYDSPSNIAGKLTEDLHSTLLHPLDTPYDKQIQLNDAPYEIINQLYPNKEFGSVSSVDGTIAVIGANFTRELPPTYPRSHLDDPGKTLPPLVPLMASVAAGNPYLWIWGSRLLQGDGTANFPSYLFPPINTQNSGNREWGMGAKNQYLIKDQVGALEANYLNDSYAIYNLYNLPRYTEQVLPLPAPETTINFIEAGYIFMTNLNWTTPNVEFLAKLIHSQMNYIGEGARTAQMTDASERINWEYMLPFGRTKDDTPITGTENEALKPLLQALATTPMGGPDKAMLSIPVAGFYNDAIYNSAFLGVDEIADNCVIANSQTIQPIQNIERTRDLDPQTAAKYYDINIIAVTNNKQNLAVTNPLLFNPETYIGIICKDFLPTAEQKANYATTPPDLPLCEKANYCMLDLAARNPINPFCTVINPNLRAIETTGQVPAYSEDVLVPEVPEFTTSTPQPNIDVITPAVPAFTTSTPQPDIYTPPVPEVPATSVNYNSTADGSVALVSDFDVANNVSPMVLGNGSKLFTDDGGLNANYSTSHSRHATFDAGAGNKILINIRAFEYEHSTYSMYDRMGITCGNSVSTLSTSSGNLSSADSTLSQYLYQSSNSSPASFWGTSWVSGNGGYGTGGGWILPNSSGTDVKGNDNSGWINTWYEIDARYIRFWFISDGSASEPGWDILVARQVNTPAVPEIPGYYTPQPNIDVVTPEVPAYTTSTPQPNIDVVTPAVPEFTILGTDDLAAYVNSIQIGTPNSSLQFDSGRGRFNFQELHWERYIGNSRDIGAVAVTGAEVVVNIFNKQIKLFDSLVVLEQTRTIDLVCANSGIGLIDVGLTLKNGNENQIQFLSEFREINQPEFWSESLLSRLGFDYKALFNPYGLPDAWFLTRTYQSTSKTKLVQYFPYPLTTNSVLDTSLALDYDQNNAVTPLPMFNLSSQLGRWDINASTGTSSIFASNLPQKLVYPFWLIYSDIIGGITFHSSQNGAESNIIAICNRSYVSGDFAYSFATDYVFTATKEMVITGITSQVLNPDLTPAVINDRTTIIYKIQKPIKMFQEQQQPPTDKEAKLKQRTGR